MKTIGLFLILIFIFASGAKAQKQIAPRICTGGVLNGKAIVFPKPNYPRKARKVRESGVVNVMVKIDEEGNVIEAVACSGSPLLREASLKAAKQAKFKPTILSGKPVKVSGAIVYNFKDEVYQIPCDAPKMGSYILNDRAFDLVKPEYPQKLKDRGISGSVSVRITIDKDGFLVSSSAKAGHKALRKYALEAVKKSSFKRTEICGKPVKVTGQIIYNFSL